MRRKNPERQNFSNLNGVIVLLSAAISSGTFLVGNDVSARDAESAWEELMASWQPWAFVPGEVIVCFCEGVSESDIGEAVKRIGGEIIKRGAVNPRRVVLSVPEGEEDRYVDAYRELREVRTVEKNYVFEAQPAAGGSGGG